MSIPNSASSTAPATNPGHDEGPVTWGRGLRRFGTTFGYQPLIRPNHQHTKKQAITLAVGFQNQKEKRPQAW